MRKLALTFGVDLESVNTVIRDDTSEKLDRITSENFFKPLLDLHKPVFHQGKIGFNGIGHVLDEKNPNVFPILRAEQSMASFKIKNTEEEPKKDEHEITGEKLTLVSGYQSTENHRAVISGSIDMCGDEMLATSRDNMRFCKELIDWAMKETGVLRSKGLRHRKVGTELGERNPENYELEDHVEFQIDLE